MRDRKHHTALKDWQAERLKLGVIGDLVRPISQFPPGMCAVRSHINPVNQRNRDLSLPIASRYPHTLFHHRGRIPAGSLRDLQ